MEFFLLNSQIISHSWYFHFYFKSRKKNFIFNQDQLFTQCNTYTLVSSIPSDSLIFDLFSSATGSTLTVNVKFNVAKPSTTTTNIFFLSNTNHRKKSIKIFLHHSLFVYWWSSSLVVSVLVYALNILF